MVKAPNPKRQARAMAKERRHEAAIGWESEVCWESRSRSRRRLPLSFADLAAATLDHRTRRRRHPKEASGNASDRAPAARQSNICTGKPRHAARTRYASPTRLLIEGIAPAERSQHDYAQAPSINDGAVPVASAMAGARGKTGTVSYTHLTLPTICSV